MLSALYLIAWMCREPSIRRKAVSLLERLKIQEGPYSSNVLARLSQTIIDMEEARARSMLGLTSDCALSCQLIPEEARFLAAEIAPDKHDKAYGRLIYVVWSDDGSDGWEVREERVKMATQ